MSCNNCNCLDCTRNRSIAKAAGAPIQRPRWQDVEPANANQAHAWGVIADHFLDHVKGMQLLRLVDAVCNSIMGLKPENRPRVEAQVERFLRESPKYGILIGGIFQKKTITNDYTCKGCGNDKCSTQEKSCWKCGRNIGT